METPNRALQILQEDAKLIDRTFKFANNVDAYLLANPPTTLIGVIGQLSLASLAVGCVAVAIIRTADDITDIGSGSPLREPFEQPRRRVLLNQRRVARIAARAARISNN